MNCGRTSSANFIGGYPVTTAYRLKKIVISLTGNDNVNINVRSYTFNYQLGTATQLSRLDTIIETGSDGTTALPATKVLWQDVAAPGFDVGPQSVLESTSQSNQPRANGRQRGRPDGCGPVMVGPETTCSMQPYLATPGPNGVTFVRASNTVLGSFPTTASSRKIFPADVNGDGRTDLLIAYKASSGNMRIAVFLSNGSGFDPAPA
jgi:hypothetical protein